MLWRTGRQHPGRRPHLKGRTLLSSQTDPRRHEPRPTLQREDTSRVRSEMSQTSAPPSTLREPSPARAPKFNTGIAMRPLGNRRMTLDEYFARETEPPRPRRQEAVNRPDQRLVGIPLAVRTAGGMAPEEPGRGPQREPSRGAVVRTGAPRPPWVRTTPATGLVGSSNPTRMPVTRGCWTSDGSTTWTVAVSWRWPPKDPSTVGP